MQKEIRKISDYTILQSFKIGSKEIALGENRYAPYGARYLVADIVIKGILETYEKSYVSENYAELVEEFAKRIGEEARIVAKEYAEIGFNTTPLTERDCKKITWNQGVINKVVVLKDDIFRPEHANITNQLHLCVGGFGAEANSRGSACFCINLYTGKEVRYERQDILGIIDKEILPEWAKKGLENAEKQLTEKNKNGRSAR